MARGNRNRSSVSSSSSAPGFNARRGLGDHPEMAYPSFLELIDSKIIALCPRHADHAVENLNCNLVSALGSGEQDGLLGTASRYRTAGHPCRRRGPQALGAVS